MPRSQSIYTLLLFLYLLTVPHCFIEAQQQQEKQKQQHPIKNIVVLVLENRSFDHMLGWMKSSINPSINGLSGSECNPISTKNPGAGSVCVSNDAHYVDPDPGHSFENVKEQVFGSGSVPSMSGFVEQALTMSHNLSNTVMMGFKPEILPVFTALVHEFAVFDRWFSSLPGPTQPNRMFVHSATSHGSVKNEALKIIAGYPQRTIFDSLHHEGLDFGVYYKNIPSVLTLRNMRRKEYISRFHWFDTFKDHASEGKLKNLSLIEPRYFDLVGKVADDDHPSHDVSNGQRLVKEVYEALRSSPQWNESLLIVTYDEHGGFYDHVQTPCVGVPSPDGIKGPEPSFFEFDRLGVRIPTIMVSPWIKKGIVISRPNGPTTTSEYEHSSIPATVKKIFNLKSPFLTKRDAWAGTFEHFLTELDTPRTDCPEKLPDAVPLRDTEAKEDSMLSEFQRELVDLAAALNGDFPLSSSSDETTKNMTVWEADQYVTRAVSRFLQASKEAVASEADQSAIVDVRP